MSIPSYFRMSYPESGVWKKIRNMKKTMSIIGVPNAQWNAEVIFGFYIGPLYLNGRSSSESLGARRQKPNIK